MTRHSTFSPIPSATEVEEEETKSEEASTRAALASRVTKEGTLDVPETVERRALRVALEARSRIGAPSSTNQDGSVVKATGLWRVVEPMYTDWLASKKRDAGIRGFVAKPMERVIDTFVVMLLGFLIALGSRYVQCSGAPLAPSSREAPATGVPAAPASGSAVK